MEQNSDSSTQQANDKIIGRVSATSTNPSTTSTFQFWTKKEEPLNISDVVKVNHIENSISYGIVTNIIHISDAPDHMANFISYDFGNNVDGDLPIERISFNYVECQVLLNDKNINNPVSEGAPVRKCSPEEIQKILFNIPSDKTDDEYIPFGFVTMYANTHIGCVLSASRILGPEAVHVNFSGVSGRAAKTTTAMCILSAIQKQLKRKVAFVLFNVKGTDLLNLDKQNDEKLSDKHQESKVFYTECFPKLQNQFDPQQLKYFLPTKSPIRKKGAKYFYASYSEANIDLLFSDYNDNNGTIESFIEAVRLSEEIKNWDDFLNQSQPVGVANSWTITRIKRILDTLKSKFTIRENNNKERAIELEEISICNKEISVIDIHTLNHFEQTYVVGSIIRHIQKLMTSTKKPVDNVVVFFDELNQFAPKGQGNRNAICQTLVDIAARGRTDGIILFTAEQFLSKVDDQVVDNSSVKIYGHSNSGELSNPKYAHIPPSIKNKICMLQNGYCIIDSADLPVPIEVRFPYPNYSLGKETNK